MASLSLAGLLPRLPTVPASRPILFAMVPCRDPFSSSFLPSPSPSILIRSKIALSALPRRLVGEDDDQGELEEWAVEEEDSEVDEGGGPDDLSSFDLESMEEEAIDAVREYSLSLSRELNFEDEVSERRHTTEKQRIKKKISKHIPDHLLPKVAIVGRPNVGKSALFNRLVGGNRAIVVDEPGVTRDRLYGRSFWGDREFMVVDTGGIMTFSRSQADVMEELAISTTIGMDGIPLTVREAAVARMPSMIEKQATAAVDESSVIIFLVDGQAGLVASDVEIADWLRKHYSNKCIILAVNKCESPRKGLMQASEFWSLGFSPIPISAISGTGTGELLDLVCSELKATEASDNVEGEENYIPSIAIVGRPNVGKSSILNALVGEERTIVSPVSGTTRDAIDTEIAGPDGQKYKLIDTAGIRRRATVASAGSTTEALSVNRAFRAIRRTDVVALVIEALACITEQDVRIAERIEREGKGCIVVVNKWDTIPKKNQQTTSYYEQDVREKLRLLDWAPIVYSTAITGRSVDKIIAAVAMVEKERTRRLGTSILNQVVQEAIAFKPPPRTRGGKRGRIYYSTQAAIRPPTFVFFVNDAKLFPETYRRYMEKQLRKDAGFPGTPIRLLWRSRRKGDKGRDADASFSTSRNEKIAAAA
ncbi:GTPase Der-like [Zingiber officinale]|uniref:GTPase Der-like n=1 Tax=Zingiber officinale TaxID=94328 RepID=UPI001C4C3E8F|nr:GTPase Der-like [Zingiber officinale]